MMKKWGWVLLLMGTAVAAIITIATMLESGQQDVEANLTVTSNKMYSFSFPSSEKTEEVYYSDDFFSMDHSVYNHSLAQASLALAISGFEGDSVKSFLESLGFGSIELYRYDKKTDEDKVAAAFGLKSVGLKSLVAVCIRGGAYGNEWGSNGRVGYDQKAFGYHYGFHAAAKDLKEQLERYAQSQALSLSDARVWITGFSRGGAVANCLAADLLQENLYCYTFAAPSTVSTERNNKRYTGIFNIVNPLDLIPRLPMNSSGESTIDGSDESIFYHWNYGKYGTTLQLSGAESESYELKSIDLLERALAFATRDEETYVKRYQDSTIIPLLKKTMGSGESVSKRNVISSVLQALPGTKNFLLNEWKQMDVFSQLYLAELLSGSKELRLNAEHWPERYWELMKESPER